MQKLQEFKAKKNDDILRSMIDYMNFEDEDDDEDVDCGYTQADIDECGKILDAYIDKLVAADRDENKIMESVKSVVIALNELNAKCDYTLIETDQREYLCPFIEDAAIVAGLPQPKEDITEEWREW